jgi:hypothetical protein
MPSDVSAKPLKRKPMGRSRRFPLNANERQVDMPDRKYPWSNNVNKSTKDLEDLKIMRTYQDLPVGRIEEELRYRREVEQERDSGSKENSDD